MRHDWLIKAAIVLGTIGLISPCFADGSDTVTPPQSDQDASSTTRGNLETNDDDGKQPILQEEDIEEDD